MVVTRLGLSSIHCKGAQATNLQRKLTLTALFEFSFATPEEMNSYVSSHRLGDEQSIRREHKDDSPWAGGLRTHVIWAGD